MGGCYRESIFLTNRKDKARGGGFDLLFLLKKPRGCSLVPILELKSHPENERIVKHHTDLSFLSSSQRKGNEGHARCLRLLQVAANQVGCIQPCTSPAHKPPLTHASNQQHGTPQEPQHHLSKKRTQYKRRKAGLFSAYVLCRTLKYK